MAEWGHDPFALSIPNNFALSESQPVSLQAGWGFLLILGRGNAGDLFIYAGEMGRGLEAEVVRRGGDTIAGTEQFVGAADDKLMNETDGGIACRFAHQVAEIAGGEAQLRGAVTDGRQPFLRLETAGVVVFQDRLHAV